MKIECTFDTKIFHNPMNKYCIFRMKTDDPLIPKEARGDRIYPDHLIRFSAVGYELPMTDVVKLVLEGDWEKGKYGLQFVVEQWHEIVPETESGVYNYLSSGLLKGIGSKTAAEIVARFGVNSLKVIENTPEKLLEIRGITPERLEEIKLSYAESRALRDIMTLLAPFKLTQRLHCEFISISVRQVWRSFRKARTLCAVYLVLALPVWTLSCRKMIATFTTQCECRVLCSVRWITPAMMVDTFL